MSEICLPLYTQVLLSGGVQTKRQLFEISYSNTKSYNKEKKREYERGKKKRERMRKREREREREREKITKRL